MSEYKELFEGITYSLFHTDGKLDYQDIQEALLGLCNYVMAEENTDWYMHCTASGCSLDELIVGAYWHFTEWHEGQASLSYQVLCALGEIFNPGRASKEENAVYELLEDMARAKNK